MTATNVQNIIAVYNLANTGDLATGLNWYRQALSAAKIMAGRYGIHAHEAAGVIAALSPRNLWERNLQDALGVARNVVVNPRLCPGGGALEMELASRLMEKAQTVEGIH